MEFICVPDVDRPTEILSARILSQLQTGKNVLWLVSGGSNIGPAVRIMEAIPADLSVRLTIGLVDERYGPPGHPDSNWEGLIKAGFNAKQATVLPILQEGLSLQAAADRYDECLRKEITNHELTIALMGIGSDGHTSGILPGSLAAYETDRCVVGYSSTPFDRITTTFTALRQVDEAYVFAFGTSKAPTLEQLATLETPLAEQPAQILKDIRVSYVYNDQRGEKI